MDIGDSNMDWFEKYNWNYILELALYYDDCQNITSDGFL